MDIHLGRPCAACARGTLERWNHVAPIGASSLEAVATRVLSPMHQAQLQSEKEVDVAWQAPNVGRIRASVFRQRGSIAISMRLIPEQIPSPESLGLPQAVTI